MAFLGNLVSAQTVYLRACLKIVVAHFLPSMCLWATAGRHLKYDIYLLFTVFLFLLVTFLCNQSVCCCFLSVCLFFSVRVMVCVEGVNISDSEDEEESRCYFLSFGFNVNKWSHSAVVHLVSYLTIIFCWSAPCKKKKNNKTKQPFDLFLFVVRSF